MTEHEGLVDLSPGAPVVVDGMSWCVESFHPQVAQVLLTSADGRQMLCSLRALLNAPGSVVVSAPVGAGPGVQPAILCDLTEEQQRWVELRFAHVMETETGFRSGDPLRALPGEPRPGFDPEMTTLQQRRRTKATQLRALGPQEARALGFTGASERTLRRLAERCRRFGIAGCIRGCWVRRRGPRSSITPQVREAIWAVREETLHRSRVSMRTRERLIHQYVRERFGEDVAVPCYDTLRTVWREWFGPGGARQRYARSAAARPARGEHVVVHRPGQVVALDTTVLAVKVRETVFDEPVSVHLTLALDVYTHSLVAFRLTLVSDTSVDVAMVIRDVMMPLPLRPEWGRDMEWPYPGIPAAVVAEFAGHRVAGLPFFAPETITTDHGAVYKNHHLVEVQRVIGANILPARVLRPTDKQAVERAFGGVRSLLLESLLGYQGVDVADRGVDPEADAILTVAQMEQVIASWIVRIWQNRRLGEHAPSWDPGGRHSPNTLFAAAMAQGGFALQIPAPELFYQLLPAHLVAIDPRRGVKIRGLWFDGPALDTYRATPSLRGGRHKGKWVIRRDPRDARQVFFEDPNTGQWHPLRWKGLPADGEVPCFNDARVTEMLTLARRSGLRPRSDEELLPLLLELIGAHIPADRWPTQMTKVQRVEHAREVAQADAAAQDRPPPVVADSAVQAPEANAATRAASAADAATAHRRHRRDNAVSDAPAPPPRLGAGLRGRSVLVVSAGDGDLP